MSAKAFDWQLMWPLPDGEHTVARGLYLRKKGAAASWILRYTSGDKRREMGLGAFIAETPSQAARAMARALQLADEARDLLARGIDPIEHRAAQRTAGRVERMRQKGLTLLRLLRAYHEACVEPRVSEKYSREWSFRVESDIPAWLLDRPACDIKAVDILAAIAEATTTAKRKDDARQRISQAFEWLISSANPPDGNPAGVLRNTRARWIKRFKKAEAA